MIKVFLNKYAILLLVASFNCKGQDIWVKAKKEISSGFYASTSKENPLWFRTNVYGSVPIESNFLFLGGKITQDYDSTYTINKELQKFNYGYGFDVIGNLGNEKEIKIIEAYFKVRFKQAEIYAGRRKEMFGLVDSTLSSGSYSWSGNALPMPKIQLSIPNYVSIIGKGLISVKGGYAHGWFDNDKPFNKNVFLHQKFFYTKIGKSKWRVNLFAGFNHQSMWGGESPFFSVNGKLPTGLKNYLSVVLGTRGTLSEIESDFFDTNRIGNHLGSVDIGARIETKIGEVNIYRQSIYDDGSLFYLTNISDGLNGISFEMKDYKTIKKICFEYLDTRNQGGDVFIIDQNYLRGRDSYFQNGQYIDGYTYKSMVAGTPFIQLNSMNYKNGKFKYDIYNNNNRIKLFHLGIYGETNKLNYTLKASKSFNLGNYNEPMNISQLSLLGQLNCRISNQKYIDNLSGSIGFDNAGLYPNTIGLNLIVKNQF